MKIPNFIATVLMLAWANAGWAQSLGERLGQAFEKAARTTGVAAEYGPVRKIAKTAKPVLALRDGAIYFNEKLLPLGASIDSWKKIIGSGSVCSAAKVWPKWCKWEAYALLVGTGEGEADRVHFLSVFFNPEPVNEIEPMPYLGEDGKPVPAPWIVTGLYPGYFEIDGFGIDRATKFWEIRSSIDPKHNLRCGLRDCKPPLGSFAPGIAMHLVLTRGDEYGELRKFSVNLIE